MRLKKEAGGWVPEALGLYCGFQNDREVSQEYHRAVLSPSLCQICRAWVWGKQDDSWGDYLGGPAGTQVMDAEEMGHRH